MLESTNPNYLWYTGIAIESRCYESIQNHEQNSTVAFYVQTKFHNCI